MNTCKTILTSLLLTGISLNLSAVEKLRLIDRGLDGNERYYAVTCPPDGKMSSVKVVFDFDPNAVPEVSDDVRKARVRTTTKTPKVVQVCIYPHSGNEQCRGNWDLDNAAKASCVVTALKPLTDEQKENLGKPLLGQ